MRQDRRASQREIEFINEMVSPLSCGDEEDDEDDENEDEEEEEPKKDEDDDDDDDEEEEEPIWTATEWDRGATCWRKV